jgi:multiple sugar transport system substrate-binding protein
MIAEFSQQYDIDVDLQLVSPMLLPNLMHTAVVSPQFDIPDIVIHPIEQTMGWADEGILNLELTNEIIDEIGRDTFDPDALELMDVNGQTAAIPLHGYQQILLYREDWFAERNLAPPLTYTDMFTAAFNFFDREQFTTGFVVPTESNLVTTHQGFEHMAMANGCQIVNEEGEILILDQACRDALDFYYSIIHNYSPPGVQTESSARNAYLAGRTGLIMLSPSILPQLAGLDSLVRPTCTECINNPAYLAENSGIITHITGDGPQAISANFGNITAMGITREADRETAVAFARYWFNEGYNTWLAVESERKVPMRWGTADQPRQFIDNWGIIPLGNSSTSLTDIYGPEIVTRLRDGIGTSPRWGLRQGQGALMSKLYESLTLSIVLQEMLSGYFNTTKTIFEANVRVIDLIPNYTFDIEPTPTPEN